MPRIEAFIFRICAVLTRTANAECPLHIFHLFPLGLAAQMMLRRSIFRGFQIGFKKCIECADLVHLVKRFLRYSREGALGSMAGLPAPPRETTVW